MIENSIISDHFTVEELKKLKITPPDAKMYKKIRSNWDSVAKPLDGMGDFELLTAKIGAVLGDENKGIVGISRVPGRKRADVDAYSDFLQNPGNQRDVGSGDC